MGQHAAQHLRQRRVERKRQTVQVEHVGAALREDDRVHDAGPDEKDVAIDATSIAFEPQGSRSSHQHGGDRIRVRCELPAGDRQHRIEKGRAPIGHGRHHRSIPALA
jgi:hypothetical protein